MILQALTTYYEALLQKGAIAAPGWDGAFKVSFWLEVSDTGELIDVIDCRQSVQNGKSPPLSPIKCVSRRMSSAHRTLQQIFSATTRPIFSALTRRVSRSAPFSALKPAPRCTTSFWTMSIPRRRTPCLRSLIPGSQASHLSTLPRRALEGDHRQCQPCVLL